VSERDPLRRLPRVDDLSAALVAHGVAGVLATRVARRVLEATRARLLASTASRAAPETSQPASDLPDPVAALSLEALVEAGRALIARELGPRLVRVLNATGVVIHTNLGRAPLGSDTVTEALGYCNLEYDLEAGQRGSRRSLAEPLLTELTGAEAALVTNNAAAALVLALATWRRSGTAGEVIVSRGELVEIGGSFRIPDILETSGLTLREVGTTNRTRADDYARAVGPRTVGLLRVHPSNYRITGFTQRPTTAELSAIARASGLPLLVDQGSDALAEVPAALRGDEDVRQALAEGADLVLFSGDKLLGGPQAGVVVGRKALVDAMARHPLMRALRADKLAFGGLESVLLARLSGEPERVPVLAMLALTRASLEARATALIARLADVGIGAALTPTEDPVGGGSHPDLTLPGSGLALEGLGPHATAHDLHRALRLGHPPIVGVVREGRVLLALRTIPASGDDELFRALVAAARRDSTTLDIPAPAL
jgi:L-seryl-tRNA(Ser) seleniumtransferase